MTDKPLILSIETATGCGSVALTRGTRKNGSLVSEITCQPEISHSRRLLGSVEQALESTGIAFSDVDGLAVSLGPGSFTGLRIGLAAAKGLAFATGLPLVGVPTLDGLACACMNFERLLCCVLDARKKEVYAGFYRLCHDGQLEKYADYVVIKPDRLLGLIQEPTLIAGPGVSIYEDVFRQHEQVCLAPPALVLPRASNIGFLGAELFLKKQFLNPATASPLYVRASEAELNLKKQKT